jgi:hypothetical protein
MVRGDVTDESAVATHGDALQRRLGLSDSMISRDAGVASGDAAEQTPLLAAFRISRPPDSWSAAT